MFWHISLEIYAIYRAMIESLIDLYNKQYGKIIPLTSTNRSRSICCFFVAINVHILKILYLVKFRFLKKLPVIHTWMKTSKRLHP